jgi:hypothetical protein
MIDWFRQRFCSLPGWLVDALTGLFYAILIVAVILLSGADDAGFRYLEI